MQPLGRWPLRRLSYQGDDTARPPSVSSGLSSPTQWGWGNTGPDYCAIFLPTAIYVPLCLLYQTPFSFFPTPPTSMGPPTEGWWGSDPAALPGLASLLIGVHLVSPAAMNAAVMLPSHRHFLGTLQRFFAHPSAVFKLLLWLWRFWRCGLLPSSSLRDKSVQHPNYDQFYIFACLSHCWNQCWITFFSLDLTSGLLCTCRIRKPKQVLLFQKIQLWP